jgi:23S rRNA (cytidine1920-2'-O)/16S rRNA (cytidine1409-2'-O)-methyltransferase
VADTHRRLDNEVVSRGMLATRSHARDLIRAGAVEVNGVTVTKPATRVMTRDQICVDAKLARQVGRGARKLDAALAQFQVPVLDRVALDIGSSTGGFTQVLLERGARRVFAVDVGTDQLAKELRRDERVALYEGTDIRTVDPDLLLPTPELVVVDVSFISTRLIVSAMSELTTSEADGVVLVKPQFEVGPGGLDSRGIVRQQERRRSAVIGVAESLRGAGWRIIDVHPSAVIGTHGNQEYFLFAQRSPGTSLSDEQIVAKLLEHWERSSR